MVVARPNQPRELLVVASSLTGVDRGSGRPRTAELRRSISTAYYAVFHDVSHKATNELLGTSGWGATEAEVVRWVTHTGLRTLCEAAQPSRKSSALRTALGSLDPRTEQIASNVLDLQEARTSADYDDLYPVSKPQAVQLVRLTEQTLEHSDELFVQREESYARFLRLLMVGMKPVRR